MNEVVRKDALEQESVSLLTRLASTWTSMLTCSAGVDSNFPTTRAVAVDGMTKGKDCWACGMVNCYLVTCEVVGQPRVVVAIDATTEVLRRVVLTVIAKTEVDGLVETLEVLEKNSNQASTDDCLASGLDSRCQDGPGNPLAFPAVVLIGAMKYCCALEVVNCCCYPDCPDWV